MSNPARRPAFWRGVLGMGTAMLLVFGARSLLPIIAFPPARLASLIVTATPGDLATFMIERLGPWALQGLALGVNAAVVLTGGAIGVWIDRAQATAARARRALAAAAGMAAGALLLALDAVGGPDLFGAAAYSLAALAFARIAADVPLMAALEPRPVEGGETPLDAIAASRRRLVVRVLLAAAGLLAGGGLLRGAIRRGRAERVVIAGADLPYAAPPDDPNFPVVAGHTPEITPTEDFYNVDINIVKPVVDHTTWRLRIHGLVDQPYELDYLSMQEDFEVVEMAHTLTCISNEVGGDLISTAIWRGVRLRDVLDRAGLGEGVVDVVFRGAEGYSDSIPRGEALQEDTLLVFGMNGDALPGEHGFPARIIVPNIYGMKNVKWLTEIEPVDYDYQGYWMVRGWSDEAIVRTQSRIDVPGDTDRVARGATLAGVAWAGDRGIRRVEISTDRGATWMPAVLKRELSSRTWRLWASELESGTGKVRVMVRAVDGRGEVQTAEGARPHPAGATGHHMIDLYVE